MKIKRQKPKVFPEHSDVSKLRRIKFGIDPTYNRLHVGHLVPLAWLKNQERKDVTVVIGRITARLGDPTGQEKTRPVLTSAQVGFNVAWIEDSVRQLLPFAWIDKQQELPSTDLLLLASNFTLARIASRDNFRDRSVGLHELFVPLLQAIDSVRLHTELEIGGEDQLFNFELTREVQKLHGQNPQACLLFPIIRGTDGQKMSKSNRNCVWLDDPQIQKRIMSIPDDVMDEWLPIFFEGEAPDHPKTRKEFLSEIIQSLVHGGNAK